MYAIVNIWVDVISFIIFVGMAAFLLIWFIGLVLSSRFTERFIRKHWSFMDHLEEPLGHEFPIPLRIWHWINLISFTVLITSGLYIRYPFFEGATDIMKKLHYAFMYIVVINFLWRVTYTILTEDRKNFKFSRQDIPLLWQVPLYYMFIKPDYPHLAKFHPIQRGTYWIMGLLLPIQAFTGFSLMWPQALLGWISGPFGGVAAAAAWMRLIHSVIFRIYFYLVMIHAYLAITETWPKLKVFWFWLEPEIPHLKEGQGHKSK